MTKWIGTAPSLKDFMRRDFLLGTALTAALFIAALLLFPPGTEPDSKAPHVTVAPSPR